MNTGLELHDPHAGQREVGRAETAVGLTQAHPHQQILEPRIRTQRLEVGAHLEPDQIGITLHVRSLQPLERVVGLPQARIHARDLIAGT